MSPWHTADGWFGNWMAVALASFILGWVVVAGPGHGGGDDNGANLAWHIGGLMVYLAFPVGLLVGTVGALAIHLRGRRSRNPGA
jgi:hypothetical protein